MRKKRFDPLDDSNISGIGVELQGGLGNQLFQFGVGFAQARRLETTLTVVPPKKRIRDTPRTLQLGTLTSLPGVSVGEVLNGPRMYVEKSFSFDADVNSVLPGTQFRGYFQSWKYVQPVRSALLDGLLADHDFASGRASLEGENFIGLHLRRGDYLKKVQRNYHGIFSFNFYVNAVLRAREMAGNLPVTIFSDSLDLAEQLSTQIRDSRVAKERSPLHNLGGLSSATAWIISNSTFGWWGSYLGGGPEAVCITPRPWFRATGIDTKDLLPPCWMTLGDPLASCDSTEDMTTGGGGPK